MKTRVKTSSVIIIALFTGVICFSILTNRSACKMAVHKVKARFSQVAE